MGTTVLVIEDDLEINELLGEYLALENMRYVKAPTGGAGIHLAAHDHPDAIILDLMLPDVDGFTVARKLTSQRATYDIPVVILSCMCQDSDREKGFQSGALFYMNKPFLPDDLLATVRQALAWKKSLPTRTPAGTLWLGASEPSTCGTSGGEFLCAKGLHQLVADLFSHSQLDETSVAHIRDAIELLMSWASAWKTGPAGLAAGAGRVRLDYAITKDAVTFTLSEEKPGLLADAFFKTAKTSAGIGASLIGWGGSSKSATTPVPTQWLQLLSLTGSPRFEKDSAARTIRFSRNLTQEPTPLTETAVPILETNPAASTPPRPQAPITNATK